MDDFTAVEQAAMRQGIDDLQTAHKNLTGELDDLEGKLNSSLAKWEGDARSAYHDAKANWDKSAQHMSDIAQKMNTLLTDILEKYNSNESQIQSTW